MADQREVKDVNIIMRVSSDERRRIKAAAKADGRTMSDFIRMAAEAACERVERQPYLIHLESNHGP